ncbi:MAG: hypothetical protein Kow0069_00060 [Promethearchaeota archaeon]
MNSAMYCTCLYTPKSNPTSCVLLRMNCAIEPCLISPVFSAAGSEALEDLLGFEGLVRFPVVVRAVFDGAFLVAFLAGAIRNSFLAG